MEVLREFAATRAGGQAARRPLRFLRSPVAIHGEDRVESIELVRNRLEDQDGRLVAVPTDEHETLECGLVFRSVGYRGVGLPDLPFDERRGTIRNEGGRVIDAGEHSPYCAGWIKRGPTGIIGTNKKDATETVALLLEDIEQGASRTGRKSRPRPLEALLAERGVRAVLYAGLDVHRRARARRRREARPAAGQAAHLGRAARGRRASRRGGLAPLPLSGDADLPRPMKMRPWSRSLSSASAAVVTDRQRLLRCGRPTPIARAAATSAGPRSMLSVRTSAACSAVARPSAGATAAC